MPLTPHIHVTFPQPSQHPSASRHRPIQDTSTGSLLQWGPEPSVSPRSTGIKALHSQFAQCPEPRALPRAQQPQPSGARPLVSKPVAAIPAHPHTLRCSLRHPASLSPARLCSPAIRARMLHSSHTRVKPKARLFSWEWMKWLSQLCWGHLMTNKLPEPPPPHADLSSPAAAAMQEAAEAHVAIPSPSPGCGKAPNTLWQLRPSFHRHPVPSAPFPPPRLHHQRIVAVFLIDPFFLNLPLNKNPNQPQNLLPTPSTSTTWGNKPRKFSTCPVRKLFHVLSPFPSS